MRFEWVIAADILGFQYLVTDNKTHMNQKKLLVVFNDYVHAVPFIETDTEIRLKTMYKSRIYNDLYLTTLQW